jgi:hypothetical protein
MHNFMVADLLQTTLATLAFTLFLIPPGHLLGLASNAFGFRSRSAAEQLLFSVAFSFAVTPVLAVVLTRMFSYKITLAVFLLLVVVSVAVAIRQLAPQQRFFSNIRRSTWIFLALLLAWFLVVQISLADLQAGHRLYVNYVTYDHNVRVPLVEAAARNGVPPLNPFYGLGKIPVLRYYYYWYVVCALPMQLFGISAKACLNASVFWSGLGLASLIPLFLKYFLNETEHLRRKSIIGIALLSVTGLDLIPYAVMVHHYHVFPGDMEWWDPNQVSSWLGSLLWVPHHVAALTACMAALLAFSSIEEADSLRQQVWIAVISGLALASAAGLSVYVTFTFAGFVAIWALRMLWQRKIRIFATYFAAGAFSLLLSWPYLLDLLSKGVSTDLGSGAGTGERFASIAIRDFPPALDFLSTLGIHNPLLLNLLNIPVLLVVYLLEFGFFFLAMVLCLRLDMQSGTPLNRQRRMGWAMFAVCLLMMSVLKSNSTGSNDLGFRGMLVVQFILLVWSAPIIHGVFFAPRPNLRAPWIKVSIIFTLLLGVAGTAYQLSVLRCYAPLADAGKLVRSEDFLGAPGFAERTYWLRAGYSRLNQLTPSSASVQYNPVGEEVVISHLYSTRQAVMGDQDCVSAFGGDSSGCKKAFPYLAAVFNSPDAVRRWDLDALCDEFHMNVLVAADTDPAWQSLDSWVWSRPSLLANPSMRAIPCGTRPLSSAAK